MTADPEAYSTLHSSQTHASEDNFIQYKNPELDKALEDSRTHCAVTERKAAFKTINQILNEEQPYNFGFTQNILLGVNKKIQNVDMGSFVRLGQTQPETWWVQ